MLELDLRRVDLYDALDQLRNAEAGKAIALDGPDEGTCIGRVASPVEDSTSTMLACLSEDEGHEAEDANAIATQLNSPGTLVTKMDAHLYWRWNRWRKRWTMVGPAR